ncbi:MAG: MarC family protein [Leptospirales bacterium]
MSFYSAVFILLLIMDPFGNIPAFLSVLSKLSPGRRRIVILREMIIALLILLVFLFFGRYILSGLHLSQTALTISGGILLFMIAIKMIFPPDKKIEPEEQTEEPMVVPLAVPLIAGPSAMAMVILFSTQYPSLLLHWFFALLVAWTTAGVILLSSDILARSLGTRSLKAIERLTGMILTVMAIQMLLSGIRDFIHTL